MLSRGSRRAFATAIAVLFAVFINYYFSFAHQFWIPLTTFLVMQSAIGATLRQILQRFLLVMGSAVSLLLVFLIYDKSMSLHQLYMILNDVVIGGSIGIVSSLFIFPHRADIEFRHAVIPILRLYSGYLSAVTHFFLGDDIAELQRLEKKIYLECEYSLFPDWVFAAGFNPALRAGHQHFLIRIQQIRQILFTLHYAAYHQLPAELQAVMREPILHCVEEIKSQLADLIAVLDFQVTTPLVKTEFSHDHVVKLEAAFQESVPLPLELLDMSEEYTSLAEFIYDLRDLQKTTLLLKEALR
jgi:hypothetical protein